MRDVQSSGLLRRTGFWLLAPAILLGALLLPVQAGVAAGPSITPVIQGTAGSNGWYRSSVRVSWQFSPAPDSTSGCDIVTVSTDTAGRRLDCSATWGLVRIDYPVVIKVDKTPPSVRAVPSRKPDANGWYNHALTVSFAGSDATSGIASCTSASYSGPYNPKAAVSGGCYDRAGNSAGASFGFAYDSIPPTIKKLTLKHGKRTITLRWQLAGGAQSEVVTRAPGKGSSAQSVVYQGKASACRDKRLLVGHKYRYTVTVYDQAANKVSRTITVVATGALTTPTPGASVNRPPRLTWIPVKGASYYNVQVVRAGATIYSGWPSGPKLQLARSWVYQGHRYSLHRGVYKWYVWPGFGALSANNYGQTLGRSSFFFAG